MKHNFILVCLLLLTFCLTAQQDKRLFPVETEVDSLHFTVIETDGRLNVQPAGLLSGKKYPAISSLYMQGADLIVEYRYDGKNNKFSPQAVRVLGLKKAGNTNSGPVAGRITMSDEPVQAKKGMKGRRVLLDAAENSLNYGDSYVLIIERSVMDIVDCREDKRPEFGPRQYFPHVVGGILSGSAIGLAQFYKSQKNDAYDDYRRSWREGGTSQEAQSSFDEARRNDRTAKNLNRYGWLALGANAALAVYRWSHIRKKQEIYDTYCREAPGGTISVTPVLETNFSLTGAPFCTIGFQAAWRF
jgi:hypothetical protein